MARTMKLQGNVAMITGGVSGRGQRTAEYIVRDKGAKVAVPGHVAPDCATWRNCRVHVSYLVVT